MNRRTALTLLLLSLLLLLPACEVQERADEPIVVTREPVPTPAPDIVDEGVERVTEATGLADNSFLGLPVEDWINLGLTVVFVLLGYIVAMWLLGRAFRWLARLTSEEEAAKAEAKITPSFRWLVLLVLLNAGIQRLLFIPDYLRLLILDIIYVGGIVLLTIVLWRLLDLAVGYYRSTQDDPRRLVEIDPALVLLVRIGRVFLAVISVSLLLTHFGINVAALSAALGLGGLALSLAARDTVADAIAGVIILFDRPFRVGDRIEIQELGTWGDVVDIGLRTTRIRTRDNRMVIVPNSTINSNQIVNYSYPDPRYRIETRIGVAYGSDIEHVRQVITDAVREVEGVLAEKPVQVLYDEMGDFAMMFRVRWWIESYADTRIMDDRVHTALQHAIDAAGIDSPFPTQTIRLESDTPPPLERPPSEVTPDDPTTTPPA
jgi:small-conductance mechanosensitive channel